MSAEIDVVELPGHGDTGTSPDEFTMAHFARVVRARAKERVDRGEAAPLAFGYSMGGYATLLAEVEYPGTFSGILTLGTMLEWSPAIAAGGASRLDPAVIQAKVPAFAAALAARHAGAGGWEAMMTNTANLLRALGAHPPLTSARLEQVQCPVTLLVGERDEDVSFDATATQAARMPRAMAFQIANVPHPIEKVPVSAIASALDDLEEQASSR